MVAIPYDSHGRSWRANATTASNCDAHRIYMVRYVEPTAPVAKPPERRWSRMVSRAANQAFAGRKRKVSRHTRRQLCRTGKQGWLNRWNGH